MGNEHNVEPCLDASQAGSVTEQEHDHSDMVGHESKVTESSFEPGAKNDHDRRLHGLNSIAPVIEPVTLSNVTSLSDPRLYINRELSLLAFQWRVMEEAQDPRNPLLERFKFLSICGSNMDEFFMVRVAGLKRQVEAASLITGPDGLTPHEQLEAVETEVNRFIDESQKCLRESLMPALDEAGVFILDYNDLSPEQREDMRHYFLQKIFPVLTPMAFDPGHPFPHISNLSLNFAVSVRKTSKDVRFARLKIPASLPQLIPIARPGNHARPGKQYIWIDDVIQANLDALFPGMTIIEAHPFHITRDAEVEIQEWEASDLLETTEEGVRQRKFGDVVRLQVDRAMPAHVLEILMTNLQIEPCDVYLVEGHFPLSSLKNIGSLDRPDLKYPQFIPHVAKILNPDSRDEDEFTAIARRDILLNHPYDSFQPIVNLLNRAADDPSVLAIKMTLYRVGRNSPVVEALLRAMEKGKQVAVVVELKARFDEESNIEWARALEREGVHVVYGLIGLKIHAKTLLIVRKSGDSIKRYIHLSTGNYNPLTAHLYTDLGLLTSDESIGSDVSDLFNYLTGYSAKTDYRKLLVAPINLRERLESLIRREIEHQNNGRLGHIILKANALVDERIIQLLYEASQAGVQVDLIVRGICCLRPGIQGISENIRVISIVGRFLEHSRIFYVRNGGNEEIFIGSADTMPRNLDRRVEVLFPIEDPGLNRYIRDQLLELYLSDSARCRYMQPDGSYVRLTPHPDATPVDCQQTLLENIAGSWSER
ncbi:MAG: polyphosphate kinase 1 [Candidatus Obscuribacterales bacterium]|nr:polyphosphate kinase 1 [Candidatus Obscuribacterales bacterium]